ncbi:MAG: chaperonin GroEL, partial [Planctomycetota bacterium]
QIVPGERPLFSVAEDVDGDALAGLILNRLRGTLKVAAIKAPAFGERRKAVLEDLAVFTGGTFLAKDLGLDWSKVTVRDLGKAKKIEIHKDKTRFYRGAGPAEAIRARSQQIESQIKQTTSSYDREKLEERLAKLSGKIAVIRVGAQTETEMKEKKSRAEDALNATRAAMEEGIVPGGGTAYLRIIPEVEKVTAKGDEKYGVQLVAKVLQAPLRQLGDNVGIDGPALVADVEEREGNEGYDAVKGRFVDMVEAGIVDPVKVLRVALQNAASIASLHLVSDAVITDIPKGQEAVQGALS